MPASKPLLIDQQGQPSYGIFSGDVECINYKDFDLRSLTGRKLGKLSKHFKFNQFQFISIASPELMIGVAIVDLKIASTAFAYVFKPETGEFEDFEFTQLLSRHTRAEPSPNHGCFSFQKGANRIEIKSSKTPGVRRLSLHIKDALEIDATLDENTRYDPMRICTRCGYQGWVYTQKANALICDGRVKWRQQNIDLKAINALASVDWSAGYMRKYTSWNWASLSSKLPDGRTLGFNLACGVNETGFTENAIWLDGAMIKVDMVNFKFDRFEDRHAWAIHSYDGKINLHFEPQHSKRDHRNLVILQSHFVQHIGRFYGEITLPDETLSLQGQWGLAEDHYAKW